MKALVSCEFSGVVRRALEAAGFDAWSCDLREAEDASPKHIKGDVREVLDRGWYLLVAHPPCTRLCLSGVRWIVDPTRMQNPGEDFSADERAAWPFMAPNEKRTLMQKKLQEACDFFALHLNASVRHVAIENPVMHRHAMQRIKNYTPQSQTLQPWQFGDWESKRVCLWLKNLPLLKPDFGSETECSEARGFDGRPQERVHRMSPGKMRSLERSRFFPGMAQAMAEQWRSFIREK